MRIKVTHCLSPDLSGRVCGTAAGKRCARVAEGQVEGSLSFASFSLAVKENEEGNWVGFRTASSGLRQFARLIGPVLRCAAAGQWGLRRIFEMGSKV
jgi:hypothetical protein